MATARRRIAEGGGTGASTTGARGGAAGLYGQEGPPPGPRRADLLPRREHGSLRQFAARDSPARGKRGDRPQPEPRRGYRRTGRDVHPTLKLPREPVRRPPAPRG